MSDRFLRFVIEQASDIITLDSTEAIEKLRSEKYGSSSKGGPRSGNFGHRGRPGSEGGSVGRGRGSGHAYLSQRGEEFEERFGRSKASSDAKRSELIGKTKIELYGMPKDQEGVVRALSNYNLTRDDIAYMMSLEGFNGEITLYNDLLGQTQVVGQYFHEDDPKITARMVRMIHLASDGVHVYHDTFIIDKSYQGRGVAQTTYARQVETYKKAGISSIDIHADIDIGRYAWAKMGFQYAGVDSIPTKLQERNARFGEWAKKKGVEAPEGGWPQFSTAHEFATYTHPGGQKVPSSSMFNWQGKILPGDYDLGKAFMLDDNGHGDWEGEMRL